MIKYILKNIRNSYVGRFLFGKSIVTIADLYPVTERVATDYPIQYKAPQSIVELARNLDLSEDFIVALQAELDRVRYKNQRRLNDLREKNNSNQVAKWVYYKKVNNGK
jgi:hypothetical protein